jgi:hypothetical protein
MDEIVISLEMIEAGARAFYAEGGEYSTELVAAIYLAMETVRREQAFATELRRHGIEDR